MRTATERTRRRLRGFSEGATFLRLASLVQDFSQLRQLSAFRELEADVRIVIQEAGWNS
jgi:hypothetical protein